MIFMRRAALAVASVVLASLVVLGFGGCASNNLTSSEREARKPLRVLFIGNSYTYYNMLPEMLQQMGVAGKQKRHLEYRMIAPGSSTLESNWTNGLARKVIAQGGWDYVVLQEQSQRPITDTNAMFRYARLFDQEIQKSGAKTVFYLTWSRKQAPEKQALITQSYASIAKELNAVTCPVGVAWEKVRRQNPGLVLYMADGSHPAPAGTYLAAAVFYRTLYGSDPIGLPKEIDGRDESGRLKVLAALSRQEAVVLQKAAEETVERWNKQQARIL